MSTTAWTWCAVAVIALAVAASLPYWLPDVVVALRVRIFALVNGDEGIGVPGRLVGVEDFKQLYANPAANGRSRGAALSDLFWYWPTALHSPPGAHDTDWTAACPPPLRAAVPGTSSALPQVPADWSATKACCAPEASV